MALLCQRQQQFKLVDHDENPTIPLRRISRSQPDQHVKRPPFGECAADPPVPFILFSNRLISYAY
jgi:hypothetical protein